MVEEALAKADPAITHVAQVHCETGTGILNPLAEIAEACARHGKGLIVDAMSSFGAIDIDVSKYPVDAVVAASGKCIEGPPGMGFVIARKAVLEKCQGNSHSLAMDLYDQWTYMQKTTQWRFTPPTHVVAAFRAALDQFKAEGGVAGARRALPQELRHADRGHGRARLPHVPRARGAGAGDRHLPRAGRPGLHLQGLLRAA